MIYLDQHGQTLQYLNDQGFPHEPQKDRESLLLGVEHCRVLSLKLPPLKDKDLRALTAQRLPQVFPHPLDEWKWDLRRRGEETLIFLIPKELLEQLRKELGKKLRIYSPAQSIPLEPGPRVYRWESHRGDELFFCGPEKLDHSLALPKKEQSQLPILLKDFAGDSADLLEDLYSPEGQVPLFQEAKSGKRKWLGLIPMGFALFLTLWIPQRKIHALEAQLEELNRQSQVLQQQIGHTEEILSSIDPELLRILGESWPAHRYAQLEALVPYFGGGNRIVQLNLQGNSLQIQGTSYDSLGLVDRLQEMEELEEVKLNQIRRDEGLEHFSLTGRLR